MTPTLPLTLSQDQNSALADFLQFYCNPTETVWVLQGYSGTGKSTLIRTLMENMPKYHQAAKLINPSHPNYELQLTATTNKAAENFSQITGMDVRTIHSFLGLRIDTDFRTGVKKLVPRSVNNKMAGYLLFIDEASMIDAKLLQLIFQQTEHCKIVFIGDPAQLPPVKYNSTPVFSAGFRTARLTQVMRQMVNGVPQANPITDLATLFRHTVETKEWPQGFKPDGQFVKYLDRSDFMRAIEHEFTRPDWSYSDSKVLAWTNNRVIDYNQFIRERAQGDPMLQVGDYVENNSYVQVGKNSVGTDQLVYISEIGPDEDRYGVIGNQVTLDYKLPVFLPKHRKAKQALVNRLRAEERFSQALEVESWVDLRPVFAQTVNKSQGSTYGKVFIDLDDIAKCNNGDTIARLAYVGISRARYEVNLTGDLA